MALQFVGTKADDNAIHPVFEAIERKEKLRHGQLQPLGSDSHYLHKQWDLLLSKHGKLWRRTIDLDGAKDTLQLVVPAIHRSEILTQLHDQPTGAHLGQEKMLSRLKQRYYWPGAMTDVKHWCSACVKSASPQKRAPLQSVEAGAPMQIVAVDILRPLPETPTR